MDRGLASFVDGKLTRSAMDTNLSINYNGPDELAAVGSLGIWALLDSYYVRTTLWLLVSPWILSSSLAFIVLVTKTIPDILRRKTISMRLPQSAWIIHGKKYDLSAWVKDHPGGEWAIELGRNRDCTGLFESYHIFADRAKLEKILARFEIKDEAAPDVIPDENWAKVGSSQSENSKDGLFFNDAFHEDVKQLLKTHFKKTGSRKMKTWVGSLMALLIAFEVYLAYLFFQGSTIAIFLLPTIGWLLCCNLAHDGSHFAVSERPWINRLASYAGMPLFFPSTCWHIQHVVQHHVYTNDHDDVDLYHFLPVCRASRFTQWTSQYHFQWLAIFFILPTTVGHLLIIVPLDVLSKQVDMITGKRRYWQCQNLEDFVSRFSTRIFLELMYCVGFYFLSCYFQGFAEGSRRAFMVFSIASFWFIVITQGAHLQRDCMVGKEDKYQSWAKRQSATSVNFRPDSYFWLIFTGALNIQSLHHVVPCVGSSQLIDIYPEYKQICAKHGVPLKEVKSLLEFFKGFLGWIQELAYEEEESQSKTRKAKHH